MRKLIVSLTSILVCAFSYALYAQQERSHEPTGETALVAKVEAALANTRGLNPRRINVESKDGVVQLAGFVDTSEQKDAAIAAAVAVPGVAEVRNELSVQPDQPSSTAVVADSVIAARVKSQLASEGHLPAGDNVHVEVQDGVVQLSGFVQSVETKARAADVASTIEGVTDVHNNIAVSERPSDED